MQFPRLFLAWLCLLLAGGALPPAPVAAAAAPAAGAPVTLRFAHVTDAHWVGGGANRNTRQALAELAGHGVQFVVHGGDTAELGAPREYAEYQAALAAALPGVPAYYVPGNHDARWLDAGKAAFRERLGAGRTYGSFTRDGVHFVLLDSTIEAATHGHFDGTQLEWLRADLAAQPSGTPVLVFFHHPPGYTPLSFMDTEEELLATLQPFNVRGVFTGHGHLHMRWERNGIPFFMTKAADEGGYKVVEIGGGRIRVHDGSAGEPLQLVADLPLARPAGGARLAIVRIEPLGPGQWRLTAAAEGLPPEAQVWYRIGSGPWAPAAAAPGGLYHATVEAAGLAPGRHRLQVWAAPAGAQLPGQPLTAAQWERRDAGPSWSDAADLDVPPGPGQPALAWQYRAGAGIQAAPAVGPDRIYAAARDGSVTALHPETGAVQWRYSLPGPVVGSPALSADRLAVADTLGNVAVLDAVTGRPLWTHRQPAPVLAEPLWAAGMLIFGDGSGTVTALDRLTGTVRWQRRVAAGPIRARATYAAGSVYVGAWDRRLHALDAFTGAVRWQQELPGGIYYSPANQPPLYYRGRLFVTRSQPGGGAGLYALDARDGRVLWQAPGNYGYSAPVLHGGLVVAATTGGAVSAFDPLTGARPWTAWTGVESFDGALSAHGGDLILGGLNGWLAAVRPAGEKAAAAWTYALGGGYVYARPASGLQGAPPAGGAGGLLYAAAMDGSLYALRAPAPPPAPLTAGSPGAPVPAPVPAGFRDTGRHPADGAIGLARAMGLAAGYPDGSFRPEAPLSRAELAALQARYLGLAAAAPAGVAATRFADVAGHWAAPAITALAEQGLVQGEPGPDGRPRFAPDRPVTRAEAVVIAARLIARPQPSPGFRSALADAEGHWAAAGVRAVEEAGLLYGALDLAAGFQPDRPITRAEAFSLLVKGALGR